MKKTEKNSKQQVDDIQITNDQITGRGGLTLFVHYLQNTGILDSLCDKFSDLRKISSGISVRDFFKSINCWFYDGSSRHLCYFDHLKQDEAYAEAIEIAIQDMPSSHQVKRLFNAFTQDNVERFRSILNDIFIWRLKHEKPEIIEMYIDVMILNNNDAKKREGVEVTYKKVLGYQSLHLGYNGTIIDSVFRSGSKHSNHGNDACDLIKRNVSLIRSEYRNVPIVIKMDAGFFDKKLYDELDRMGVIFVASGKNYDFVKTHVESMKDSDYGWERYYDSENRYYDFFEFGYRCNTWDKFYRAIFTRIGHKPGEQMVFDFCREESVIITNLGMRPELKLSENESIAWLLSRGEAIIYAQHQCGKDELVHRAFKDFGFQELPFQRFQPNQAVFYCMLISFAIFEAYKNDVLNGIVPNISRSYATTVRRIAVDFAAKIVRTGHRKIMKVTRATYEFLKMEELWQRCQNPPKLALA